MKPRSAVSLGAILLVLIIGLGYLTFGVLRFDPLKDYTNATVRLPSSGGLVVNSPILLAGIPVGKVTAVRKAAIGVETDIRLDNAYQVPVASTVAIENLSALGEAYLQFAPTGTGGPFIADHQVLDLRNIKAPMTIPRMAVRVVELLNGVDPAIVQSLVGTVSTALIGTESVMPQLQRSTQLLAATILSRTTAIRQLFTDLQTMGGDLDWAGQSLNDSGPFLAFFGQRADEAITEVSQLADRRDPLAYTTGDGVVPFLGNLDDFLGRLGPDLTPLGPALQPLLRDATTSVHRLDISALITQALNTVGDDGALHLQVEIK
ncbi:MlaD family protein [Nocardia sp. NBC_00511]|uniref:MlaD family protein n=1 Tax=Nocardia sp. NBC_00511 TaxID=2903591 RepID=UPI0030E55730